MIELAVKGMMIIKTIIKDDNYDDEDNINYRINYEN